MCLYVVLEKCRPIVTFEQHIMRERFLELCNHMKKIHNYKVFMINEIIEGNLPDCRNFLAIPAERDLEVSSINSALGRDDLFSEV